MGRIKWLFLGLIGTILLSTTAPVVASAAAAGATASPAGAGCDASWYEKSMAYVPTGRITNKGQAQPIEVQIDNDTALYKTNATLSYGSTVKVYGTLKVNGSTYYALQDDKFVKASTNVKFEALPEKVRNCMEPLISEHNVNLWVAEASKIKTPIAKLAYLFTTLTDHVAYDYALYEGTGGNMRSHTSTGALAYGMAVCDGYASALQVLLTKAGIVNKTITGSANNGSGRGYEAHMWNLVKLDGFWYHVDSTWGDNYIDQFHYFLLPDQDMGRNHKWSVKTYATNDKYAYFDRLEVFNMDYVNGTYDEIRADGIYRVQLADKKKFTRITPANDRVYRRPQIDNGTMYYLTDRGLKRVGEDGSDPRLIPTGVTNDFIVFNGHIYYTHFIVSFDSPYEFHLNKTDLDGSNPASVHTFTDPDHNFSGFYLMNNGAHSTLYYYTNDHELVQVDSY
ncbi:SLAP domain-containing protein [Paenibacillus curdlanolyticus]|nr:SLAP domain-containing protein [Paenibacillus curdlanolyticus]